MIPRLCFQGHAPLHTIVLSIICKIAVGFLFSFIAGGSLTGTTPQNAPCVARIHFISVIFFSTREILCPFVSWNTVRLIRMSTQTILQSHFITRYGIDFAIWLGPKAHSCNVPIANYNGSGPTAILHIFFKTMVFSSAWLWKHNQGIIEKLKTFTFISYECYCR